MRHKLRKNRKLQANKQLRKIVLQYLKNRWSPEQIAKRLILLYPNDMSMRISHEAIYSYIYVLPRGTFKRRLISYLRRSRKYRRKKHKNSDQNYSDRYNKTFVLQPGWNTISMLLSEVQNSPKTRSMNLENIENIGIFIIQLDKPKVIFIDNVLLKK